MDVRQTNSAPSAYTSMPSSETAVESQGMTDSGQSVVKIDSPASLNLEKSSPSFEKTPLAKRIALPFKTAANNFLRWTAGSGLALSFATVLIGGIPGAAITGACSLPIAGMIKLGEMLTGSKKGIAGKFLKAGALTGFCAGGLATGLVAEGPVALASIGIGLAAGVGGLCQGSRDAYKGDMNRIKRNGNTLEEFFDLEALANKFKKMLKKRTPESLDPSHPNSTELESPVSDSKEL